MLNVGRPHTCVGVGPRPFFLRVVRRCPTLPHPHECSTIGAVGLSFRIRNGTGRFRHAMTTVTRSPSPVAWLGGLLGALGATVFYYTGSWCFSYYQCLVVKVSTRNVFVFGFNEQTFGFVGWEPHSEREHTHVYKSVCGVSYRPISTGQLHESLVLASTSGLSTQWSAGGLSHV